MIWEDKAAVFDLIRAEMPIEYGKVRAELEAMFKEVIDGNPYMLREDTVHVVQGYLNTARKNVRERNLVKAAVDIESAYRFINGEVGPRMTLSEWYDLCRTFSVMVAKVDTMLQIVLSGMTRIGLVGYGEW